MGTATAGSGKSVPLSGRCETECRSLAVGRPLGTALEAGIEQVVLLVVGEVRTSHLLQFLFDLFPAFLELPDGLARRAGDIDGEFWARADKTDITCREYRLNIESDDTGEPQFGIYRSNGC